MSYNFLSNQADKFRFDKFLELHEKKSTESPKQFFFEYIRRNPNINFDENLQFFLNKMYEEFMFKSSRALLSNEITETLRILTKIFYRIKNCDTLEGFCGYFNTFKKQGIIQTDLSLRSFRKNLRWINKYSYITPTYYFDWKSINMAIITCHLKFNPLLEKAKVDKIINQMPFLIMPKLSITNFAVEISAYFVIPRIYIKDLIYIFQYLKVEKYLILTDLVSGDYLLRSVYGSNTYHKFIKKYNPLQNLIWKPRAKKWMNHKLFSKTFEYLYPELILKEKVGTEGFK